MLEYTSINDYESIFYERLQKMEADEWFMLILIDALVSVPLYFTVMIFFIGQSEKQYLNELEIYFAIFFVIFATSTVVLKTKLKQRPR